MNKLKIKKNKNMQNKSLSPTESLVINDHFLILKTSALKDIRIINKK
jgi:hypothetical protein